MVALRRALLAAVVTAGLAGCQDAGGRFAVASPGLSGAGTSGTPIAVEIIEGAPQKVRAALAGELSSAAAARRVEVVGPGAAVRYRVRGYLTAETTPEGGPALAFVWDVFDDKSRLTKRLSGSSPISQKTAADPWSGLDKAELARLAERSMDEIAEFLSANATADPRAVEDGAGQPG